MKTILSSVMVAVGSAALLSACSFGNAEADLKNIGGDNPIEAADPGPAIGDEPVINPPIEENPDPTKPPEEEPPPAARCDMGKTYTGFAGTVLTVGRVDHDLGMEQQRTKPFSALATEYPRVLGNTPALIAGSATTFDSAPARWYMEPAANAVSVYTAYRIAFQGCLTMTTTPAQYGVLPSNTTAEMECTSFAKKFWSRTPTAEEVSSCVKVAMVDTSKETAARRRWAYTCASVLTSAGFLTY